ncbi:MAG: dihydroorotate dehydrogenase electron transfer subunit [Candidatus Lokiarchaeota archaeon]
MIKNRIKTVKVLDTKIECKDVKTITLNMEGLQTQNYPEPLPGQFLMIWVPGIDEIPMSISGIDDEGNWQITVKKVGDCTKKLFNLEKEEFLGFRGPLGNNFSIPTNQNSKIFLVGGGTGLAPLRFLSQKLTSEDFEFILLEGAKLKKELIYINEFENNFNNSNFYICTEDGSYGKKGLVTETFHSLLNEYSKSKNKIYVYSCGPEKMLYEVYHLSERVNVELQVSLERIMRCGCGLCGLCSIDPVGFLVCKDGPIFTMKQLKKMDDFGKFKRDFSGKKIQI